MNDAQAIKQTCRRHLPAPPFGSNAERVLEARRLEQKLEAQRRGKKAYPIAALRLHDLKRLREYWFGHNIPDTPHGRALIDATTLHHVLHPSAGDPAKRIRRFFADHAPWMSEADLGVALAQRSSSMPSADNLGRALRLDDVTRTEACITTIAGFDFPSSWLKKRRAESSRERSEKYRRKAGAKSRADSLMQQKPWKADGVSRSTYYRRLNDLDQQLQPAKED